MRTRDEAELKTLKKGDLVLLIRDLNKILPRPLPVSGTKNRLILRVLFAQKIHENKKMAHRESQSEAQDPPSEEPEST